jgi:hypothetical protein
LNQLFFSKRYLKNNYSMDDNIMKKLVILTTIIALAVMLWGCIKPQKVDFREYVGSYPSELLKQPAVVLAFKSLLKSRYNDFDDRIISQSPMEIVDYNLFGAGCKPNSCGSDEAAFTIDVRTGELCVVMLVDGKHFDKFGREDTIVLPEALETWVEHHKSEDFNSAPKRSWLKGE